MMAVETTIAPQRALSSIQTGTPIRNASARIFLRKIPFPFPYSRVTLVDIRYIHPDQIGDYVNFQNQDVLFLYSTLILNSGRSLK